MDHHFLTRFRLLGRLSFSCAASAIRSTKLSKHFLEFLDDLGVPLLFRPPKASNSCSTIHQKDISSERLTKASGNRIMLALGNWFSF
jgi:hypothetical protein